MEVFPIGPAGRFFDAERCVYVRTVRFGFFFAQVTRVSKKTVMCVCLSVRHVCLSRARGARFLTMRCRRCWCYCYCLL